MSDDWSASYDSTIRHNLFGIDRLLNRALVYVLLFLAVFLLYLGPFLLFYRLLPGDPLLQTTVAASLLLLVGLTFDWVRTQVQRLVDRPFYGGWYDYPGVVETVSDALARSRQREQLVEDLRDGGIRFQAHNLLDRQQRYSPSDLTVSGMAGDIKTSVYFVQAATPLVHDFYIVRLFTQATAYTVVVLLQPLTWDKIDGDTVEGHLDTVVKQLPVPVRIRQRDHELVVVDYEEWKQRIRRLQGEAQ